MTATRTPLADKDSFLGQFARLEKELTRLGRPAIARLRKAAIARFDELGLPGPRDEDWRFTSLAPVLGTPFELAGARPPELTAAQLAELPGAEAACRLVFVNGLFTPALSRVPAGSAAVTIGSLAAALETAPDLMETHLGRHARYDNHPLTALNTAFFRDGALVSVGRNQVLHEPIYLVFVSVPQGAPLLAYPRNLILAGSASQLSLIEVHAAAGEGRYWSNVATEIVVEDGAVVDHYKVQQEGPAGCHFANTQIQQQRSSTFRSHYIGLGGAWVRNEVRALLDGEGCECTLNGLYRAGGQQHMDNHTVIDHAQPHCASHELYKGILDGKAHGVFNGKIFVRQDAQKTDAKQTNQTLLLSDDATINTTPQLEIYADDVKCTHGATVGQLDSEALFYLRSRGLGLDEARTILIGAFANDILGRVPIEALRQQLEKALWAAGPAKERP
jgi:Fe-S cluster assembly protein SufD